VGSGGGVPSRGASGDFWGQIPQRCGDFTAFSKENTLLKHILAQISAEKRVF